MCQNFDYYSGFQHKTTAAGTYATQCILTTSCPMSLKRTRYRFHIKIICKSLIPLFVLQNSICIVSNIIKSDPKQMLLLNNCYKIVSGHFFAVFILIFHKTEVHTVILRCLTGLNLNWCKSYGLRCNLRLKARLANFQKIATDKRPFYDHIWPFFYQLHEYFS